MSNNGPNRVYQAGRSTDGWKKGARIRSVGQMPDGTHIISVSHSFQSENLAVVTEQRPLLPGVWAAWCSPDGRRIGSDVFVIHQFMLDPEYPREDEYYLARPYVRDTALDKPAVLVIEMLYRDFDPRTCEGTAYYERQIAFSILEDAQDALKDLYAELALMDEDLQCLFNVYIRDENVKPGNALEALREIAGYTVWSEDLPTLREDPYWGRFPEEDLERYQEEGSKLA